MNHGVAVPRLFGVATFVTFVPCMYFSEEWHKPDCGRAGGQCRRVNYRARLLGPGPGSSAEAQFNAASALASLADDDQNKVLISAAGAIPRLVQLLGPASSARMRSSAARTLADLAEENEEISAVIDATGCTPLMRQLLEPRSSAGGQAHTADDLERRRAFYVRRPDRT